MLALARKSELTVDETEFVKDAANDTIARLGTKEQNAARRRDFALLARGEEIKGGEDFVSEPANRRGALGSNSEVEGFRVQSLIRLKEMLDFEEDLAGVKN